MEEAGLEWRNYYNDTPWEPFLEHVTAKPEYQRPLTEFYDDAKKGTLPSYAWINPRCAMNATTGHGSNDQHPDHDVALGEALYKDIYEVRASVENGAHIQRALQRSILGPQALGFGHVMQPCLVRTISKGERRTRRSDAHCSLL